jgi:DNA helicase HerA-like ATPase
MYVERDSVNPETTNQERRADAQPEERILGRVVHCDGARATIAAFAGDDTENGARQWAVGRMISINLGETRTVGLVYAVDRPGHAWNENGENAVEVSVELIGEVRDVDGRPVFDRGITLYPQIGAVSHRIRGGDLQAVYDLGGRRSVQIGTLSQDDGIAACVSVDDTLNRHFAVVGTTGVGKSTAVSLFLRKAISSRPDLRVLILDPHNEFAATFPDQAIRIDSSTLDLPFWLFRLEEFVEVLYRGREPVAEEVELLRSLIPQAKQMFRGGGQAVQLKRNNEVASITADTPVPYRIADLVRLIVDRMGLLESKADRPLYRALRTRLESAMNDPRYRFMFSPRLFEDTIQETIGNIFRVPHNGRPITCVEMAGMPAEVVNSVCSVLARLAFDLALWSNGKLKLLVLCEEAHRYMPADSRLGFAPTRHALSRIAKEGRKYGCYLGVVTQRPGELDPTILSQCSTVFAMRLANERDQEIIRSAIADSSASTLSFLSSMGQREAIAFGEGVATTMRMKFEKLSGSMIPGSVMKSGSIGEPADRDGDIDLKELVDRLRNVPKQGDDEDLFGPSSAIKRHRNEGYRRDDFDSGREASEDSVYGRRSYDDLPRAPYR